MMPLLGNFSDTRGRKFMLTFPMTLAIFPLAILAYSRTKEFFYASYVLTTLISMVSQGSVQFLALAYVADNVPEDRRGSVFGILSGICSCSFVCGNLSTRFLSTSVVFQLAAAVSVIALAYMRLFLQESINENHISEKATETDCLLQKATQKKFQLLKTFDNTICLLRTSSTFSHAALISFFMSLADVGVDASFMYYFKAQFHFEKDQFADLMIINGIAGTISQLLLMPLLVTSIGEKKLLSVGLFFSCICKLLLSFAWSSVVPYVVAPLSALAALAMPCLQSIASKQFGPCEQGRAQGCLTGIRSFVNIVSPLVFSPLNALFLSERAPFHFPGFTILCAAFAGIIALIQSIILRTAQPVTSCSIENP